MLIASESPFVGHLAAAKQQIADPGSSSGVAGGMAWATIKGNLRARNHPSLQNANAQAVMFHVRQQIDKERCLQRTGGLTVYCGPASLDIPPFPFRTPDDA